MTSKYSSDDDKKPELRIDSDYIAERRLKYESAVKLWKNKDNFIIIFRVDRTIFELSKKYNIPILTGDDWPPTYLSYTFFYFMTSGCAKDFKHCCHPDCCFPEHKGVKYNVCSRCKRAPYCSKVCQIDDWKRHKNFCKKSLIE